MRSYFLLFSLLLTLAVSGMAQTAGDEAAIRAVLDTFLSKKDPALVAQGIYAGANIVSLDGNGHLVQNKIIQTPARHIPKGFNDTGKITIVEPVQTVSSVDVDANGGAVAKVESTFPPGSPLKTHIQYIALLKVRNDWKIAGIIMPSNSRTAH